jgi:hypothetical protein
MQHTAYIKNARTSDTFSYSILLAYLYDIYSQHVESFCTSQQQAPVYNDSRVYTFSDDNNNTLCSSWLYLLLSCPSRAVRYNITQMYRSAYS